METYVFFPKGRGEGSVVRGLHPKREGRCRGSPVLGENRGEGVYIRVEKKRKKGKIQSLYAGEKGEEKDRFNPVLIIKKKKGRAFDISSYWGGGGGGGGG